MDDEIPGSAKNASHVAIVSSIFIAAIIIVIVVFFILRPQIKNTTSTTPKIISPTISTILSPKPTVVLLPTDILKKDIETYISPRLNISFNYSQQTNLDTSERLLVKESGNRVYLYPASVEPESGQFIETFDKKTNETLDAAIRRLIIVGKDPTRCLVTKTEEGDIVKSEITYPNDSSGDMETFFANTEYCSKEYAQTNGARYFMEDKRHPNRFFFVSIGQYGIMAGENTPWQNTIKILN
ncbi:hypothetical protein BH09PAT2_BH09PAT2_06270 [soil metagenome]